MIRGIGLDLVEVERMAKLLRRHGRRAEERLFTQSERDICRRRRDGRAECYAARFAAKEAALKALGTGLSAGVSWHDVEILKRNSGGPDLRLYGTARSRLRELAGSGHVRLHLSLSHETGCAVAVVVVESIPVEESASPS